MCLEASGERAGLVASAAYKDAQIGKRLLQKRTSGRKSD